jgi:hypothetical protein
VLLQLALLLMGFGDPPAAFLERATELRPED